MGSLFMRVLVTATVLAAAVLAPGCSGRMAPTTGGGLSVVVVSDMNVPKDLTRLHVTVADGALTLIDETLDLAGANNALPRQVARVEGKGKVHELTIVVQGLLGAVVRVERTARVSTPIDRVGVLVLELEWLCAAPLGQGGSGPPRCEAGATCVGGACLPPTIDVTTVPGERDADPLAMFSETCFDLVKCFASSQIVSPRVSAAGSCTVARPSGGIGMNFALELPPGSDGLCTPGGCYVPLNGFSLNAGWWEEGGAISLPESICARLAADPGIRLRASTTCPTKTVSFPACQPSATVTRDGGGGTSTDGPDAGVLAPARLRIDPSRRDFGYIVSGQVSGVLTVTVRNTGDVATGKLVHALTGKDASAFEVQPSTTCGPPLAAGASCVYALSFKPTAVGQQTAQFTVSGDPGGSVSSELLGIGVASAALEVVPNTVTFDDTLVSAESAKRTITVTNKGQDQTGTIELAPGGSNPDDFVIDSNCSRLAPAASCTVTTSFRPRATGARAASIRMSSNPGGLAIANLLGTGLADARLELSAPSIDLGSIVKGRVSPPMTLTVRNTGDRPTGALSINRTGPHAQEFAVAPGSTCNGALAPGAACLLLVQFAPNGTGARAAIITIASPSGGSVSAAVSGTGISEAALTATPVSVAFAPRVIGSTSPPESIMITNGGGVATGDVTVSLSGANAEDFIVAGDCAGLAPGASCELVVSFKPLARGVRSATLTASASPGGSAVVNLSARGQMTATLSIASPTLSFGSIVKGTPSPSLSVTVKNDGDQIAGGLSAKTTGPNANEFSIEPNSTCAGDLPPGASCQVFLKFTPLATGSRSAQLEVVASPGGTVGTALSGNGIAQAALGVSASTLVFAPRLIGSQSSTQTVTVTNNGGVSSGSLAIAVTGPNASDFIVTNNCGVLAAGASCTVSVAFKPMARSSRSAVVSLSSVPGGMTAINLAGTGQADALLSGSSSALLFGSIVQDAPSASLSLSVTNTGDTATGAVSVAVSGTHALDFTTQPNSTCNGPLAAGASCQVFVIFRPSGAGARSAQLNVSASPGGMASATLSGTGIAQAALGLSVSNLTFVPRLVGSTSAAQTITVTNNGGFTSGAISVSLGGENPGDFNTSSNCGTIAPGASCTVSVTSTPTTRGDRAALLTISANPGGSAVVNLGGKGQANASLSLSATSLAFGSIVENTVSAALSLTVTNNGDIASGAFVVQIGGSNASDFAKQPNTTCSGPLPGGSSCQIFIVFTPGATGNRSGQVSVTATPGNNVSATLSGTGIAQAALVVSSPSLVFPSQLVQTDSNAQSVTVTNNGAVASGALAITMGGPDSGAFLFNGCSGTLAAGASCTLSVRFSPPRPGTHNASLSIVAMPGGTAVVNLSGPAAQSGVVYGSGLSQPGSVAIHPDGRTLFFADWISGVVYQGDIFGSPPTVLSNTGVSNLRGLCLAKTANPTYLYVMGHNTSELIRVTIGSGATDRVVATPTIAAPHGCAVSPDQSTLYVGGVAAAAVFAMPAPGGNAVQLTTAFGAPVQLAINSAGSIIFSTSDAGGVYRFAANVAGATPVLLNPDGGLTKTTGIVLTPDEQTLYVGDDAELGSGGALPAQIVRMPSGGGSVTSIFTSDLTSLQSPVFMALDPTSPRLWVGDPGHLGNRGVHVVYLP